MTELNGKTYEMQYLTDEEAQLINYLRRGADVNVCLFEEGVSKRSTFKNGELIAIRDELKLPESQEYMGMTIYSTDPLEDINPRIAVYIKKATQPGKE